MRRPPPGTCPRTRNCCHVIVSKCRDREPLACPWRTPGPWGVRTGRIPLWNQHQNLVGRCARGYERVAREPLKRPMQFAAGGVRFGSRIYFRITSSMRFGTSIFQMFPSPFFFRFCHPLKLGVQPAVMLMSLAPPGLVNPAG